MQNKMQALIALGANLPHGGTAPEQTLFAAMTRLDTDGFQIESRSRLFKTPCFPKGAGPDYVNAAVALTCAPDLSPRALLQHLHSIEAEFGRQRETRWGMRTLDLDLLAFGDHILPDPAEQTRWRDLSAADQARLAPSDLILPHPRLQDRAFVLVPLCDIAPDWVHPLLGRSVRQMCDALSPQDRAEVQPFG